MKQLIYFLLGMGLAFLLMYDYTKVEVIDNTYKIDSVISIYNQYKDSTRYLIDSLSEENKIKDTTIIIKKYEAAKDGITFINNDSLYKVIFKSTDHL